VAQALRAALCLRAHIVETAFGPGQVIEGFGLTPLVVPAVAGTTLPFAWMWWSDGGLPPEYTERSPGVFAGS
jgi:hypothetical protein